MNESFGEMFTVGGKSNSLGRTAEVVEIVLNDRSRLEELYGCLFIEDSWVRMRAADGLEKVCRKKPDWLEPYVDRFNEELASDGQPSVQWHLAQMYTEIRLTDAQRDFAINWLKGLVNSTDVDWIVSSNAMGALLQFSRQGFIPKEEVIPLFEIQTHHTSKAVRKRARTLLETVAT